MPNTTAIILAAGSGTRMQSAVNKNLLLLAEKPVLAYTLHAFDSHPLIRNIILVAGQNEIESYQQLVNSMYLTKPIQIILGGKTRQESCWLGVQHVADADLVVVHDGARPLVNRGVITGTIEVANEHGAAIAAVKVKDTLKEINADGFVTNTPDRSYLWQAQTPQTSQVFLLRKAHELARQDNYIGTDEASLLERIGCPVKIVESDYQNLKITTPNDLIIAEQIMKDYQHTTTTKKPLPLLRVGMGHDSHRFVPEGDEKPLILGGITVKDCRGLAGNSDADVVLHAIFNALSQAIGARSLGHYADKMCLEHGITDSQAYIKVALKMIRERHYIIGNIGISLECKRPRIEPIVEAMKHSIADLLNTSPMQVGITATSGDGLTAFGRGEGIQVFVIVHLDNVGAASWTAQKEHFAI